MPLSIVDGIKLVEEDTGNAVIFNFYTWVEVIKGIMIEYAGLSPQAANDKVMGSTLVQEQSDNYASVVLNAHDTEYHWAMLLAHGELYWRRGISAEEPDGYVYWESCFRSVRGLAKDSFVFIDMLVAT